MQAGGHASRVFRKLRVLGFGGSGPSSPQADARAKGGGLTLGRQP